MLKTDTKLDKDGLEKITKAVRKVAEEAPKKAAKRHADKAKALAPVDTGTLRAGIRANGGEAVSEADYSGPVNFGTVNTPPQPFFTQGLEEARREFVEETRKALKD